MMDDREHLLTTARLADRQSAGKPRAVAPHRLGHVALAVLMGAGSLLGWNAVLTAGPYFIGELGGRPDLMFSWLYKFVELLGIMFVHYYTDSWAYWPRLAFPFCALGGIMVAMPFVTENASPGTAYWIDTGLVVALAVANAILDTSLYSVAPRLRDLDAHPSAGSVNAGGKGGADPETVDLSNNHYIVGLQVGEAIAGVTISGIRIVCYLLSPHTGNEAGQGVHAYFMTAGALSLVCAIVCGLAVYRIEHSAAWRRTQAQRPASHSDRADAKLQVFKQIWPFGIAVFLCYTVTLSIFPGLLIGFKASQLNQGLYILLLIFFWNVGDMIGRPLGSFLKNIPTVRRTSRVALPVVAFLRMGLVPAFIYIGRTEDPGLSDVMVIAIDALAIGVTNGALSVNCMELGPDYVRRYFSGRGDAQMEKSAGENSGGIMVFLLVLGITLGCVGSLVIEKTH